MLLDSIPLSLEQGLIRMLRTMPDDPEVRVQFGKGKLGLTYLLGRYRSETVREACQAILDANPPSAEKAWGYQDTYLALLADWLQTADAETRFQVVYHAMTEGSHNLHRWSLGMILRWGGEEISQMFSSILLHPENQYMTAGAVVGELRRRDLRLNLPWLEDIVRQTVNRSEELEATLKKYETTNIGKSEFGRSNNEYADAAGYVLLYAMIATPAPDLSLRPLLKRRKLRLVATVALGVLGEETNVKLVVEAAALTRSRGYCGLRCGRFLDQWITH
jgi:hypothetical protein